MKIYTHDEINIAPEGRIGYYTGYVYAIEYGNDLKIGCTRNPKERLMHLSNHAMRYSDKKLGRFILTPPHDNYRENERLLHSIFSDFRINDCELFNLQIESITEKFDTLSLLKKERNPIDVSNIYKLFNKQNDTPCNINDIINQLQTINDVICKFNDLWKDIADNYYLVKKERLGLASDALRKENVLDRIERNIQVKEEQTN